MLTVRLHRLAVREFHAARRWYEKRSTHLGERFRIAIKEAINHIEQAPDRSPPDDEGMRWRKTNRFPYLLHYYLVSPDELHIYAIAHEKRRPGYWKRRQHKP